MSAESGVTDRVLEIAREVLLKRELQIGDNLFDAGADSLTFLEICTQLEEEYEIEIPLDAAWEASTVDELRQVVEKSIAAKVRETA